MLMEIKDHVSYIVMFVMALCYSGFSIAQSNLSNMLDKEISNKENNRRHFVYATFKGTHLVNANTIETIKGRELDFRVSHRFGDIGGEFGGEKRFFGLDNSTDIKISFDYGISDRLNFGIARAKGATAVRQLYEASLKFKLIRQGEEEGMPITVTAFSNVVATSMPSNVKPNTPDHFEKFQDRLSFAGELMIGCKISDGLSIMVMPVFVHTNYVIANDDNNVYAIGVAGRLKLTRRMSLVADYYKVYRSQQSIDKFKADGLTFYNPLGAGFEFETGGHVFDLTFTNCTAILENQFIPYTTTTWKMGQFRWGFNLSRIFSFKK
ncbi:hypothetical protein A4D02_16940 [Niastella koreensis]|uniref:DUF5777 domain-containing protein n=3 Tax=Niastella koreensis TaxID=354356 RepID=G8TF95_NIAKG|nr:hypothetical protein Niako_0926 [Niastella koreensis GR20-10]OQP39025.1 hypothetical protein A4D02_16940 [Niastella koreensis]